MALAPDVATSTDPATLTDEGTHVNAPGLQYFVFALFFIFGGITSLNDVILPKLKELFTLNYTEAMLVQFCFFTAYLMIGIPGAELVKRIGYMRGAVAGLLIMMAGCLLFIPASQTATYGLFLGALFILASGVVIVQVVTNPLISLLGPAKTVHSRLTFAQAFNSLGTTIFPRVGSALILGSLAGVSAAELSGAELAAYRTAESAAIVSTYIGLAVALAVIALVVWINRNKLPHDASAMEGGALTSVTRYLSGIVPIVIGGWLVIRGNEIPGVILLIAGPIVWLWGNSLLSRTRFSFGAACIFLYVGAEVAIGSLIVNYLMQDSVMGLSELDAGNMIWMYWGGALVGRIIGSLVLRYVSPGLVLMGVALGAITLVLISTNTTGATAGYSLLAVGLMNSIMFPTIFSLASEKLGLKAADGSGIINIAIFGGAVIPLLTGMLADASGSLRTAMILPIVCYGIIAAFGMFARRPA
ncbi:sugar MFS transporter [Alteriqipengyuania flavescens]|uniref:sugar MFS transporter n=1 Tax=Alteriqipengyuania flavescens TaxID=3053610 RepID=UPI0025B5C52F|nr:sugar MFS transporter [Alteriqipengyuania flavescens]WJY18218.1 sugar MFS transporter [Alteriqipengyuania flavescens]WJY24159.1 sugar MFS transporter [Alteriqipengyuania flavescens]